jgi:hypothetical protein
MDEILKKIAIEVCKIVLELLKEDILLEIKRALYPIEIKGHELAGRLLGIGSVALTMRLGRGLYIEGVHYKKKSDRIYIWNRDALLEAEKSLKGKNGFANGVKRA